MGFARQEYWSGVPLPCPSLRQQYWFAGYPPGIQQLWLLLSQCEGFSACLLFSSLCEILCLLGKYLLANCFWLQIHGPSWWRALTNHPRSTHPGGTTQYLSLSTKWWGGGSESVSHKQWMSPHSSGMLTLDTVRTCAFSLTLMFLFKLSYKGKERKWEKCFSMWNTLRNSAKPHFQLN